MASIISAGTTSATALNMSADTSGILQLASNNGTVALTIGTNQYIGVGVTNPITKFQVNTGTNQNFTVQAGYLVSTASLVQAQNDTGGSLIPFEFRASQHSFDIGSAEAMRIDTSGNLCVGTTSAYLTSVLSVTSSNTNNSRIVQNIFNSAATSTTRLSNTLIRASSNANGADACLQMTDNTSNNYFFGGNSNGAYVVCNTGGVRLSSGGTAWASDSDERLKDIIEPISDALTKVDSLRSVIGKYKTDNEDTRRSFLIAQDVQAVLPEAVVVQQDEIGTLSLAYTDVIPLLVASIKELNAKIISLEEQVLNLGVK